MKRGLNKENSLPDPEFGGESSESARAIHYVVQKDTLMTYVSALIAQADPGIVSGSTIERKKMSTKTIYKRIALVAVATLGAGVLSVAPASATVTLVSDLSVAVRGGGTNLNLIVEAGTTTAGDRTYAIYTGGASTVAVADIVVQATGTSGAAVAQRTWIAPGTIAKTAAAQTAFAAFPGTNTAGTETTAALPAIGNGALSLTGTPAGITTTTLAASEAGTVYTIFGSLTATALGTPAASSARAVVTVLSRTLEATLGDGGVPTTRGAVNGVAGPANTVTLRAMDSDNTAGTFNLRRLVTVSGAGARITTATAAPVSVATDGLTAVLTPNNTDPSFNNLTILTPQVGTITASIFTETAEGSGIFGTTAASTVTITVNATASSGNVNTVTTTATLNAGATHGGTADDTKVTGLRTASATPVGVVKVTLTAVTGSVTSTTAVTASITGSGSLVLNDDNDHTTTPIGSGRSLSSTVATTGTTFHVLITPDGTSGVGTVTITAGTFTTTKTVTFYGAVSTLTVKQNHRIAPSTGGTLGTAVANPAGTSIATTPAVVITARDANGVLVPNLTITALSSDTTVMQNEITVNADDGTVGAGAGTYNASVSSVAKASGSTATLTFRVMSGTTVLAAAAPITYTLGGAVASVALSLNKASYTPGEAAIATLTLRDASGNAAFDADHASILTANLESSLPVVKALAFSATANAASSIGGVATVAFNAPGTAAERWTVTGTTGTGPATAAEKGKALSASAAVAVPANAEIASLTTLVNSLIAKINALNKLVIKIQKKVRA
jgi:trimeric autotransporter adhesin